MNLLGAAIGNTWYIPFENDLILWLQSLGGEDSFIYYLMNFITMFGESAILVGVTAFLYWGIDKKLGERVAFGLVTATLLNPMIKNVVCRTRPFDSGHGILNLRDVDGYSFPSGHSSGAAAAYVGTAVVFGNKKGKWLTVVAIALPLLVALSRLYLGAHYPTDVAAGLALGVASVFLCGWLYSIVSNKYYLYFGALIIGAAGFLYCTTSDFFTGYGILLGFTAAIIFEEKVVNFENTKLWWRWLLRLAVGGGIFFGLNSLIKAIVGAIYPVYEDNAAFERTFRMVRYAVIVFVAMGVYPLLFKPAEKLWRKWGWIKEQAASGDESALTD